jgi:anthranilate synthase component 1
MDILSAFREEKNLGVVEIDHSLSHQQPYCCIGFDPYLVITCRESEVFLENDEGIQFLKDDPITVLRHYLRFHTQDIDLSDSGFMGGALGFFGYEAVKFFENVSLNHQNVNEIPDMQFFFYRKVICFYPQEYRLIITLIDHDCNHEQGRENFRQQVDDIFARLSRCCLHRNQRFNKNHISQELNVDLSDREFQQKILAAKKAIQEGEIFQIVLSRTFSQSFPHDPLEFYRYLRLTSEAPYKFYICGKNYYLIGASPEKLVSLQKKILKSAPIAGTYSTETFANVDQAIQCLIQDPKENAEHVMLVDLARNDLGKVAKPGTVKVTEFKKVHQFKKLIHLISNVQGEIADGLDALDVIQAAFPAGTLSGAPKIRAIQMIDSLEFSKRHAYGGCICLIDSQGNLDSCIAIRMAQIYGGKIFIRAGAGIVADSNPEMEILETKHKAGTILSALYSIEGMV